MSEQYNYIINICKTYFIRIYNPPRDIAEVRGRSPIRKGLRTVLRVDTGVACIGLIGLSTFMISRRIKEIAIRKVLGATLASMVSLFSRDFVWLILLANVVALPFAYFLVDRWLSTFAFRTQIGWVMFITPAALLLLVSLVTVCVQTIRTGTSNPARVLRAE